MSQTPYSRVRISYPPVVDEGSTIGNHSRVESGRGVVPIPVPVSSPRCLPLGQDAPRRTPAWIAGWLCVGSQGIECGEHELEAERELIRRVVVGGDERRGGLVEVGELVRRELGKVDVLDHVRELMG